MKGFGDDITAFIRENYLDYKPSELAIAVTAKFGVPITVQQIIRFFHNNNLQKKKTARSKRVRLHRMNYRNFYFRYFITPLEDGRCALSLIDVPYGLFCDNDRGYAYKKMKAKVRKYIIRNYDKGGISYKKITAARYDYLNTELTIAEIARKYKWTANRTKIILYGLSWLDDVYMEKLLAHPDRVAELKATQKYLERFYRIYPED